MTAYVGQNISVNCSVSGYLNYNRLEGKIYKSGFPIPSTTGFEGNLFVVKANVSTDGVYQCTTVSMKRGSFSAKIRQTTIEVDFLPCKFKHAANRLILLNAASAVHRIPCVLILATFCLFWRLFIAFRRVWMVTAPFSLRTAPFYYARFLNFQLVYSATF